LEAVRIGESILVGPDRPLVVIAGPCVIESEEHALAMAVSLRDQARAVGFPLIFKSSFDKANRSSIRSYRGPGLQEGLRILERVKQQARLPLLSDIHEPGQAAAASKVPATTPRRAKPISLPHGYPRRRRSPPITFSCA